VIKLGFVPNGLLWEAGGASLYIVDSHGARIVRWTEAGALEQVASLPPAGPESGGYGQIIRLARGTFLVARLGMDTRSGGVIAVAVDGTTNAIAGLDPDRRRIGLALAPDGTLYETYFEGGMGAPWKGGVARFTLAGGEMDVITTLDKPVGIVATADALLVADQGKSVLLRIPRNGAGAPRTVAQPAEPDLLCQGEGGEVFGGNRHGQVYRVDPTGTLTEVARGLPSIRGIACDGPGHRLFVAAHREQEIHILHLH
jgi:sugar lactone lactonase YvrE